MCGALIITHTLLSVRITHLCLDQQYYRRDLSVEMATYNNGKRARLMTYAFFPFRLSPNLVLVMCDNCGGVRCYTSQLTSCAVLATAEERI